ncbi:MAG: hypothetical protein WBG82_10195 [Parvibaculum sp.]
MCSKTIGWIRGAMSASFAYVIMALLLFLLALMIDMYHGRA